MEAAIEELGIRARYEALWTGAEFPEHLQERGRGVETILNSDPEVDEKLVAMKHLVEEAVAVMPPHLSFGRDPDAPAFKFPPAAFMSFLRTSHSKTRTRILASRRWSG